MNFLLVTVTLSLHLLCMNAATAGPLACVWLDWRERRGDRLAGRAGRFVAGWSLLLFLAGIALGAATALLTWTPAFWRELLERFPSRIHWGAWELVFSAVLLAVYWLWWRLAPGRTAARAGRTLLALLAATNLMYHFPPLFTAAAMLSAGDALGAGTFNDATLPRLTWQGEVLALTIHFWLASAAVAGAMLVAYGLRRAPENAPPEENPARMARWGAILALVPTLLQIPAGLWLLSQVSPVRQNRLLGADLIATAFLAAGVLAALALMHHLASLAMGDVRRGAILRALVMLLLVVLLMTAALRRARPPESRSRLPSGTFFKQPNFAEPPHVAASLKDAQEDEDASRRDAAT